MQPKAAITRCCRSPNALSCRCSSTPALARWIEAQGHTAEHVIERNLADADDRTVWNYAISTDAVIVTKDEDFAIRRNIEQSGPQVAWIRLGNTTRRDLLHWLTKLWPQLLESLSNGEPLIEIT